ncbi:uncharacterized protein BT62DRAFT_968891 [Guyanagaster necrorhizus]|uniref:LIM-domain binding protein-domain-containing protein n=1 Tax=Guyanagaster necrorhizus TaxID=856835 RepID=A0A9P7VT05_9AGAR|nr:uncharacterized protein BT62DRAFT_968891 [Guyanagaster necrorhizus MCA 3950]KAG7446022.1 hypothetical protein BT62DRAFT_968891 [Guyanagaster necrorhizus MCA 3950]
MNVNVRPEMLRQPGMGQPPMMALNSGSFMQSPPQPGQQQQLGMPSSTVPPMGMLGGGPPNQNPSIQHQRYPMSVQQQHPSAGPTQRPMLMRPVQPMNPSAGGAHMSINFGNNPVIQQQQQSIANRRVSHGQPLPPGANHIGSLPMGMNQQGNMPTQMRQPPQPHGQPQQPQMRQPSGHMSPEMAMGMRSASGNPGLPQNVVRTGSAQLGMMNGIPPPAQSQSMQGGMQSSHQNNFQSPVPLPLQHQTAQIPPSPRPPSHPSSHTPAMNMGPGPSQPGMNRSQMPPDNPMAFIDFSTPPQFSAQASSGGNNQFPFVPSSTPPTQMGEMSRALPSNIANTPPNRTAFQLTPAQQFEQMQQQGTENYNSFGMPPPPRPPSHNHHHAPLPQSQPSSHPPSPSDNINTYPRPLSRPRSQSGRPSSSHTPRITQSQLPSNPALAAGGRIPSQHTGPQPQPGLQPQVLSSSQPAGPPRPSNQSQGNLTHGSPASSSTASSTDQHASASAPRPQPVNVVTTALGSGQGLTRLLQFSGNLSNESRTKLQLSWWNDLIKEYFTPKSVMKITLWKDNQKTEAKPFEIGVPILPRFFLVTTQSGVKSMTLTLDGARERMYAQGHSVVECVTAVWTYKYNNGYTVTLRGPLTAHVVITSPHPPGTSTATGNYVLKFEDFQFDANYHDKFIALDSIMGTRMVDSPKTPRIRNVPTPGANGILSQEDEDKKWEEPRIIIERGSIPGEPVNAFGIPQATMRCLELAESVAQMTDLITFSSDTKLGPIDALNKFANRLRDSMAHIPHPGGQHMMNGMNQIGSGGGMMSYPFASFPTASAMGSTTLYSSAPPSVTNPASLPQPQMSSQAPPSSMNSPQNAPLSAHNSPTKQHKTIPHNQNASSTASSSTPTSTANTPALSNASLKRKQPSGNISPTTGSDQPPPKRATRKRGRTTGGG